MRKIIIPLQKLDDFCNAVLLKSGVCRAAAASITDSLLYADLRGIGSHGIARLSTYVKRVEAGVMSPDPDMDLERDLPAAALLNARNGFGQIAGIKAMNLAIEKAGITGAAVVSVKNSNHFGVAAFYVALAVRRNMIGLALTNASPAIPAYNTKVPLMGTNPLAVGIPAAAEKAVILDMSTSAVARGKIRRASLTGEKIPFGWARDGEGRPTDDPHAALKGFMEPVGGPKGAGLALVIDLLCGVLSGSGVTGEVKNITDISGPSGTGHMFIAIDVEKFAPVLQFTGVIDGVIRSIKNSPSIDGTPVYLPGEKEENLSAERRANGIPVSADVVEDLAKLAAKFSIAAL